MRNVNEPGAFEVKDCGSQSSAQRAGQQSVVGEGVISSERREAGVNAGWGHRGHCRGTWEVEWLTAPVCPDQGSGVPPMQDFQ